LNTHLPEAQTCSCRAGSCTGYGGPTTQQQYVSTRTYGAGKARTRSQCGGTHETLRSIFVHLAGLPEHSHPLRLSLDEAPQLGQGGGRLKTLSACVFFLRLVRLSATSFGCCTTLEGGLAKAASARELGRGKDIPSPFKWRSGSKKGPEGKGWLIHVLQRVLHARRAFCARNTHSPKGPPLGAPAATAAAEELP